MNTIVNNSEIIDLSYNTRRKTYFKNGDNPEKQFPKNIHIEDKVIINGVELQSNPVNISYKSGIEREAFGKGIFIDIVV